MEHLFVVLALALTLVMLFSACGGNRVLTPAPTPMLPDSRDLQTALFSLSDLPSGWTAAQVQTSNELSTLPCGASLPDVGMVAVSAAFAAANGEHVSESLAAFHSGDAEAWLTALQKGSACDVLHAGDNQGTPVVALVSHLPAPAVGDQSFALSVTTGAPSGTYVTNIVYVRLGEFILQIGSTTIEGTDPDLTTTLVQQAVHEFQDARLAP